MKTMIVVGVVVCCVLVAWLIDKVASGTDNVEGRPIDLAPETEALFDEQDW